jgi:hypothetical protein
MDTGFKQLHERGRDAILTGGHDREPPLGGAGLRWGVSAVLRPSPGSAARLDALAHDALRLCGRDHWPTGSRSSAHLTLRSLEPRRTRVSQRDPAVARYAQALRIAAASTARPRLNVCGLLLTPGPVMAAVDDTDGSLQQLALRFRAALGDDAAFEGGHQRVLWYVNLVHFTGPISEPLGLVEWVESQQELAPFALDPEAPEIVRWAAADDRAMPVSLAATSWRS